jgi:hypothetical protein
MDDLPTFFLFTGEFSSPAGRYTDQAMRDVWKGRKQQQLPWGEVGSYADTSEAAIRSVVLAAR